MVDLKRVSVEEARRLVDDEDYRFIDVRSMPEYEDGHPAPAYNIPFLHKTPQGMIPNPDFVRMVEYSLPDKGTKIVTSCQMGGRSVRAAAELKAAGYENVVDMKGGFGGEKDEDGSVVNQGWRDAGYPVETGQPDGRSYKSLGDAFNREAAGPEGDVDAPAEEAAPEAPVQEGPEGMNRFASSKRTVMCARKNKELPGLKRRPYPGELGQKLFDTISAAAWDEWVEHSKMIINEYRIHSADPSAMKMLYEQCEAFFFGDGVTKPEQFTPE